MSKSGPLREIVKTEFYPFALERGFVRGKATSLFVPFRRMNGDCVQVFDIQWDKSHRPRFVINFGEAPAAGVTHWGKHIEATAIDPVHCPVCGRMGRLPGGTMGSCFQTRKPLVQVLRTLTWSYQPQEVTGQLIARFSDLETWWATRQTGPTMRAWTNNLG